MRAFVEEIANADDLVGAAEDEQSIAGFEGEVGRRVRVAAVAAFHDQDVAPRAGAHTKLAVWAEPD